MTEIETYQAPGEIVNRRDMRDRATDSWTDVLAEVGDLAARIADTDFVPASFKGSVPAVAATILRGREVGFAPMTALASLHSIKGRVGLYAEAMRALVFQAGHEIQFSESTSATCTARGRRTGSTDWTAVTWTIADARQAGLLNGNPNWTKYPRVMLQARASTELCRMIFPDVIRGLASVEELEQLDTPAGAAPAAVEGGATSPVKRASRKPRPKVEAVETPDAPLPEDAAPEPGAERAPKDAATPAASAGSGGDGGGDAADPPEPALPEDEALPEDPDPGEPVEGDVVEAEVVEESEPRMTTPQQTALMAGFTNLGVIDRAERLQITVDLIGRTVDSAKQLSKSEASSVIDTLVKCETRDDLENVIRATVGHREGDGS